MKAIRTLTLLAACLTAAAAPVFAGSWRVINQLPGGFGVDGMAVGRYNHGMSNGFALVGGQTATGFTNMAVCYNFGDNSWTTLGLFPFSGAYASATQGNWDTLLVSGGYDNDSTNFSQNIYYYDNTGGNWQHYATMLKPRFQHGMVNIGDGFAYTVGGDLGGGLTDSSVERLSLTTLTTDTAARTPFGLIGAVTVLAQDSGYWPHIYVFGGMDANGSLMNTVLEYDTTGGVGTWSAKNPMPGPGRWNASGAWLQGDDRIYIMGGIIDSYGHITRRVDIYDPKTDSWTLGDSLPVGLKGAGAGAIGNSVFLFGGSSLPGASYVQTDTVWRYGPFAPNPPPLRLPLANGKVNHQQVNFFWGSVPMADRYEINVTTDPNFDSIDVAWAVYTDTNTTTSPVSLGPEGDYYWRVRAFNDSVPVADTSNWSQVRRLTLDMTPPAQPIPSTPYDGFYTNTTTINFSWSAVADARRYRLQVDNIDGSFASPIINDSTISAAGAVIDMAAWGDDLFYWRVEAIDSAGNPSGYHSIPSFVIDQTAPAVTYHEPMDGATNTPVTQDIVIGFSEPMGKAFGTGSFTFTCSPDPGSWLEYWSGTGDSVRLTHNQFATGATIVFTVTAATDRAGNNIASAHSWNFATAANDNTPPSIGAINILTDPVFAGADLMVRTDITDDRKMGSAVLRWGAAGSSASTDYPLTDSLGLVYKTYVPASQITGRGVQFQIEATDSAGNVRYFPNDATGMEHFIKSVHFAASFDPTANILNDKWQMISIPADARGTNIFGQLSNELGPYDNTKWRLFEWNGNTYHEISAFAAGPISKLGQAYWLRHRTSVASVAFEGPDSSYGNFIHSKPCTLALSPGWNDVGTPFLFTIDWANVVKPATVEGPYFYDGTTWLPPDSVVSAGTVFFSPYRGFAYRNNGTISEYLEVLPCANSKAGAIAGSREAGGWQATVTVEGGEGSDRDRFGIDPDADAGRDQYDYSEPPSGLTGTSGCFHLAGERVCRDLRPELGAGQTWDYSVACGAGEVAIECGVPSLPGVTIHLADLARQASFALAEGYVYRFTPEPGERERRFKLVAGDEAYVRGTLGSVFSVPAVTLLGRNRPNPFSGSTVLDYQLAAAGRVTIALYNVAGQRVRTLVDRDQMPGRYGLRWDGRDERGRSVAAGVYVCRLAAPGTTQMRKMAVVR